MEDRLSVTNECESSCDGTETDLQDVRRRMMPMDSAAHMADWFKAFSDPTRLRIIDALLQKELCVHDLTVLLDMGQSAVSHQLRSLRNMRIVKRRKEGKTVYYSLDDRHIEEIFLQTLQHISHD
ncbi:ArsR/SmtB family transcription factor [Aureibacillus halotolerans]|uniref:ArsR family transcriptional regulator n=1 Tax=Aureibacillus halotolerans TaxID=1508390 RepID=A0A4R6UHE5_9BACI|nr:metalloregulator ArsR/SmtB family transcription factor [Aureibacillus halotolerans]TDQ42574.1 ArsR family transcriptional regulator [Aureibacillus halotolerans]